MIAASEADLRAQKATLIALVADLAFENVLLRRIAERELLARNHGDRTIERLQRRLHREASAA